MVDQSDPAAPVILARRLLIVSMVLTYLEQHPASARKALRELCESVESNTKPLRVDEFHALCRVDYRDLSQRLEATAEQTG